MTNIVENIVSFIKKNAPEKLPLLLNRASSLLELRNQIREKLEKLPDDTDIVITHKTHIPFAAIGVGQEMRFHKNDLIPILEKFETSGAILLQITRVIENCLKMSTKAMCEKITLEISLGLTDEEWEDLKNSD